MDDGRGHSIALAGRGQDPQGFYLWILGISQPFWIMKEPFTHYQFARKKILEILFYALGLLREIGINI